MSEAEVIAEIITYKTRTYKYSGANEQWYVHTRKYCSAARKRCWMWFELGEVVIPNEVKERCVLYNLG
jgi:hypothetical protein